MSRSLSRAAYSNSSIFAASFICFSTLMISSSTSFLVSFLPDFFWALFSVSAISKISRTDLMTVLGTMPCSLLKSSCFFRRRSVSSMAARILRVMVSA